MTGRPHQQRQNLTSAKTNSLVCRYRCSYLGRPRLPLVALQSFTHTRPAADVAGDQDEGLVHVLAYGTEPEVGC